MSKISIRRIGNCAVKQEKKHHLPPPSVKHTLTNMFKGLFQMCFPAVLFLFFGFTSAHVGLSFPPARKYALDFLDNIRTHPPCGMPKGDVKTSIKAGSIFNISWTLGYPHKGGFKIELLDSNYSKVIDLTPKVSEDERNNFVDEDPTAQSYKVSIPEDLKCEDCTIRLLRQAKEWSSKYLFWSCADVDILMPGNYQEDCFGHGKALAGRCRCDRLYHGHRCQFKDECSKDKDCGQHGSCVDVKSTSPPMKKCFCKLGFFGDDCKQESPIRNAAIQEGLYTSRDLAPNFKIYWRILKASDEIEVVLKAKSTNYLAIGWRPKGITKNCQRYPEIDGNEPEYKSEEVEAESEPESESDAETEAESESEAESKSEAESESTSRPESGTESTPVDDNSDLEPTNAIDVEEDSLESGHKRVQKSIDVSIGFVTSSVSSGLKRRRRETDEDLQLNSKTKPNPGSKLVIESEEEKKHEEKETNSELESNPESESEPEGQAESESEPEGQAESESEPEGESNPKAESEPEGESEPERDSESEPNSESESEPEGKADSEPEGETQSEPEAESGFAEPAAEGEGVTKYTPKGEFHAMDCTDMVIGVARDSTFRIADYYTRDRSTPQRDGFWGGEDDLSAAMGYEKDGETVIFFRKKLKSKDFSDHDITNENMHVIWAMGQEIGDYVHRPSSGLEDNSVTPSIPNFYMPDEIKYHGKQNRGVTQINFYDEVKQNIGSKAGQALGFCGGEWKLPRDCSPEEKNCDYFARWIYKEGNDEVDFEIQSKFTDKWTGIGFSETPQMSRTDMVIGWVQANGRTSIQDYWANGYFQPAKDSSQDLKNKEGSIDEGVLTIKFTRSRQTKDSQDVAFDDENGIYLIFPTKGGKVNPNNKRFKKHEFTPVASSQKVLIKPCRNPDGSSTFTTTPRPPQLRYEASMKFVDLGPLYKLPVVGTKEYTNLKTKISSSLRQSRSLSDVPGFQDVIITKFKSDNFGEFVANMVVVVNKDDYEFESEKKEKTVENALSEIVESKTVGSLKVDPQSLQLKTPVAHDPNLKAVGDKGVLGFLDKNKIWIIIGCVAALVIIALIQASCTIYKTSQKASPQVKEKLSGQSSWRDFSAPGGHHTNYAYETFHHEAKGHHSTSGSSRNGQPPSGAYHFSSRNGSAVDPRMYSLPRTSSAYPSSTLPGYGTAMGFTNSYDRRGHYGRRGGPHADYAPDHYFMPSQRKHKQ